MKNPPSSRVIPIHFSVNNLRHIHRNLQPTHVNTLRATAIRRKIRRLNWGLLCVWCLVSFSWVPFARDLNFHFGDWTFNFWMAAQGSVLLFLLLTVVNAWLVNRWEKELTDLTTDPAPSGRE